MPDYNVLRYNNNPLIYNGKVVVHPVPPAGFPTTGLLSYWRLDETSGTNTVDAIDGENGTASNARVFNTSTPGMKNTCADFSVAADYIATTKNVITKRGANGNLTIAFWIKNTAASEYRDYNTFYADWCAASLGIAIRSQGGNGSTIKAHTLISYVYPGNYRITANNVFTAQGWYHIIWTLDASYMQRIYVNNIEKGNLQSAAIGNSTNAIHFGANPGNSPFIKSQICIDEVAMWNREITTDERTLVYNAGAGLFY
jgi:hypothetical protein